MKKTMLPGKIPDPCDEINSLTKKIAKAKCPKTEDIDRYRQLVVSTPDLWDWATQTMQSIREQLIEKISSGFYRVRLLTEVDILRQKLHFDTATPLEQLLIDHILTAHLRLIYAEYCYNCVVNESCTFRHGEYWNDVLTASQKRYLRAIETLSRVRRLALNTPALQINIAQSGGQQVNVQNDVKPGVMPKPINGQ